jgi:hypothetical protein
LKQDHRSLLVIPTQGIVHSSTGLGFYRGCPGSGTKGAIGSLQAFFDSLGAGAGAPGSYHAMQKPTWSFCLVATTTILRPGREIPSVDWLAALARERNSTG